MDIFTIPSMLKDQIQPMLKNKISPALKDQITQIIASYETNIKNIYDNDYNNIINYIEKASIIINGNTYKINIPKSVITTSTPIYPSLGAAHPQIYDLRSQLLGIRNQGNYGSCVCFSTCCLREFYANATNYLSPSFIFHLRTDKNTNGMTIDNALNTLQNIGVCYEKTYPYSTIISSANIPANAIIEANNFKINAYALITSINNLKDALYNYGPCIMAIPVYNYSLKLWEKNTNDTLLGGHCVTVVGFNDISGCFIIRNSWGTNWGDNGYTYFPYTDWGMQWEVWTANAQCLINSSKIISSSSWIICNNINNTTVTTTPTTVTTTPTTVTTTPTTVTTTPTTVTTIPTTVTTTPTTVTTTPTTVTTTPTTVTTILLTNDFYIYIYINIIIIIIVCLIFLYIYCKLKKIRFIIL
jgi:C1A family cysteine protease